MVANRRSGLTSPFSCEAPKTTARHLLLVPRSQQSVYNQKKQGDFMLWYWASCWEIVYDCVQFSHLLSNSHSFVSWLPFLVSNKNPAKNLPPKKHTSAKSDDVSKVALNILPSNMVTVSTMPSIALTSPPIPVRLGSQQLYHCIYLI